MDEKLQIDIYKGLPIILEKIKTVALAAVIGKTDAWITIKLRHNLSNGKPWEFIPEDIPLINNGINLLGQEISQNLIEFNSDREDVIEQVKVLDQYISMPYIYDTVMGKKRHWYAGRMVHRKPGRKVCTFKEDDILAINMAAMQIANELKSIEFVLK